MGDFIRNFFLGFGFGVTDGISRAFFFLGLVGKFSFGAFKNAGVSKEVVSFSSKGGVGRLIVCGFGFG